ncbi:GGDEF domain-containing protein [Floricoccus tropicus]|nr:GGDEF domain-containing protein [Floricoccus tropicus]
MDEINTALKNGQIDKLTGTYNFTAFEEYSEFVSKDYADYTVSILDLDNFKKFNDRYGHLEGNRVLATFSQIMQDTMKMFLQESEYRIFRFGGEEFVIVFLNKRSQEVKNFLISLEVDLKTYYEEEETPDYKVTFSAGIKRIREKTFNGVNLAVELADKTLYKAKEDGRDRIYIYEEVFESLNKFEFLNKIKS